MPGPFTARRRPASLLHHDWLAEFPAESQPKSRLLEGATTEPIIAHTAPPSFITTTRARTHRSMLLTMSAMALMASAGTAIVGLWMPLALTPVPASEWPVSPPPIVRSNAGAPNPAVAAPALAPEAQATPEPAPESAPAAAVSTTTTANTPAPVAPPAARTQSPAVAREDSVVSGANEVSAILSVLDRYRLAFSSLHPGSVRAVAFDNCSVDVQGVQAEAVCAGRVSLVTRAGSHERNIQSRRWTFTLVRGRDAWRIQTAEIDR